MRGYALSGQPSFLAPYTQGLAAQQSAATTLRGWLPRSPGAGPRTASAWSAGARLAHPLRRADDRSRRSGKPVVSPDSSQARRSSTRCAQAGRVPGRPRGQPAQAMAA